MAVEVKVPALGESIVEATVGRWLRQAGEFVREGEPLLELETDKVNVEVPAPQSGQLTQMAKGEGETVTVGEVLATLEPGPVPEQAPPLAQSPAPAPPTAPGPAAAPAAAAAPAGPPPAPAPGPSAAPPPARPVAPPSVRRLAAQKAVNLAEVQGSGPGGRITRADVERAAAPAAAPPEAPSAGSPRSAPASAEAPWPGEPAGRREERQRMSRRRLTIARQLVQAQHTAAMLTTFNEVDMSAILKLRQERKEAFRERQGVSLGFMSFFTKAVVSGLKAFPRLNAEIQGEEIVLKRYYDIGIAVATEEGLVVPVVRDADRLSFAEIEREIARLADRARQGTLSLEEIRGGTFTITNGGVFGSLLSTPILNPPQVGILGMHGVKERPVAVEGQVVIRPMMYVALSYDHRIVDGSESVRFLVHVKERLEDPLALMLEG